MFFSLTHYLWERSLKKKTVLDNVKNISKIWDCCVFQHHNYRASFRCMFFLSGPCEMRAKGLPFKIYLSWQQTLAMKIPICCVYCLEKKLLRSVSICLWWKIRPQYRPRKNTNRSSHAYRCQIFWDLSGLIPEGPGELSLSHALGNFV